MDKRTATKLYRTGYWDAACVRGFKEFGQGSVCLADYTKGFTAGTAAVRAGRAQRTMVWSTQRVPMAKAERGLTAAAARREARAAA